ADARSSAKKQREDTFGQTAFANTLADRAPDQFARTGVGCMRLHDYRISGCQGRRSISASSREGQRKVARSENNHRTQRPQHGTQVWLGKGVGVGVGMVN